MLLSADRPTAIVYDNDIMAVAGAGVAAEMGFVVPDDVSLLAWDDSQLCRITHPTLSAMSHDVHHFGAEVARALFSLIEGKHTGALQVPTPSLTPRGSTAPAPQQAVTARSTATPPTRVRPSAVSGAGCVRVRILREERLRAPSHAEAPSGVQGAGEFRDALPIG